ncbi:hypothetical protein, partial [uncultured Ruminococcus sp.]|uniref:hypothetical protein n=1 Tax=uncultured Ruminococcus sp. TaxID=165186 RepID=UPI002598E05A
MQQREQTFKKTPHKARLTALCGVFLTLTTFGGAMADDFFMAIPHKDCATDASSNFSSDETKSGV